MRAYELIPSSDTKKANPTSIIQSFVNILGDSKEAFGYEIHARHGSIQFVLVVPENIGDVAISYVEQECEGISHRPHTSDLLLTAGSKGYRGVFTPHAKSDSRKYTRYYHVALNKHTLLPISLTPTDILPTALNILGQLKEDEKVVIQCLFQSIADEKWKPVFMERLIKYKETGVLDSSSLAGILADFLLYLLKNITNMFSKNDEENMPFQNKKLISLMHKKLESNGVRSVIRFAITSPLKQRRERWASSLQQCFQIAQGENQFILQPIWLQSVAQKQMSERKMPIVRYRAQVLSEPESSHLLWIPHKDILHPWVKTVHREVDESLTTKGFLVGHNEKIPVHLTDDDLDDVCRTLLAIASPGWGKSTIAENLLYEYITKGHGAIVFDTTSGMLAKRCVELIPKEHEHRLIILDLQEDNVIFNMSALGSTEEEIGESFIELFEYVFDTERLFRSQSYLSKLATAVFADKNATLLEFEKFLENEDFRNQHLEHVKKMNPMLYVWWKEYFPKLGFRVMDIFLPILTRLQLMTTQQKMQNLLCARGGKLDPYAWMNEGKIVIVNLAEGFKEPQQRLIMSLFNYALWNATLRRGELLRKGIEPLPFHMFYDEPQTYMNATPMFERAISKARKYRVSPKFFIQNAEQIIMDNSSLWKNIVAMNPHLLIGSVSNDMAKIIAKDMKVSVDEILAVKEKEHHWVLRTFHKKREVPPVIMRSLPPAEKRGISFTPKKDVLETCRKMYAPYSSSYLQEEIGARRFDMTIEEYRQVLRDEEPQEVGEWEYNEEEEQNEKRILLTTIS